MADAPPPPPPKGPTQVYDVKFLTVDYIGGKMNITFGGDTTTPNWTNPTLQPVSGSEPSEYAFSFVATPPSGFQHQTVTPITGTYSMSVSTPPSGVLIYANENALEWFPD